MGKNKINADHFNNDIKEFLMLFSKYNVQYLIVGGEATIYYGHVRLTGDIDLYYSLKEENVNCLYKALKEFWQNNIPGINNKDELSKKGMIFQFGIPPNRIDLINDIDGIVFDNAWKNREIVSLNKIDIYYMGLTDLIFNKKRVKRPKDLDDLKFLESIKKERKK